MPPKARVDVKSTLGSLQRARTRRVAAARDRVLERRRTHKANEQRRNEAVEQLRRVADLAPFAGRIARRDRAMDRMPRAGEKAPHLARMPFDEDTGVRATPVAKSEASKRFDATLRQGANLTRAQALHVEESGRQAMFNTPANKEMRKLARQVAPRLPTALHAHIASYVGGPVNDAFNVRQMDVGAHPPEDYGPDPRGMSGFKRRNPVQRSELRARARQAAPSSSGEQFGRLGRQARYGTAVPR